MNFQEHRVVHVDGHPILEIFWRMIQTWQQANITMRKIPLKNNKGERSHKYLNTPGDSIRNFVTERSLHLEVQHNSAASENYQLDPGGG